MPDTNQQEPDQLTPAQKIFLSRLKYIAIIIVILILGLVYYSQVQELENHQSSEMTKEDLADKITKPEAKIDTEPKEEKVVETETAKEKQEPEVKTPEKVEPVKEVKPVEPKPTPTLNQEIEKAAKEETQKTEELIYVVDVIISTYNIPNLDSTELATIIVKESKKFKIDPLLTTAIIYIESTFNRYASSPSGKVGLMQIYPDDAKDITKQLKLPYLGKVTLYHPLYNIRLGLFKLDQLRKKNNGDMEKTLKLYSSTSGAEPSEDDLSDDQYLQKIQDLYLKYQEIKSGP